MSRILVEEVIDKAKISPFHWRILFWCTLIIIFDGYDLVIYGVVLPILMQQWQLDPVTAGALGSTALFGMMIGAMLLGTLSDRFGRKKMIVLCIVLFSGFTALNGFAQTPLQFGVMRFIAGLGIGGVMPNVVALMSEYSPRRIRSTLVAVMFSGYAIGGMLSAVLGIWIVPQFGWQVMFYLAVIPLLLLPLIWTQLPDSVAFLVRQGKIAEARKVLAALTGKPLPDDAELAVHQPQKTEQSLAALFSNNRALSTLMFFQAFFMCLLMVYGLGSWLPKLMTMAGYGFGSSLMFLLFLNIGGIIGAIGGGWLSDRFHPRPVLMLFFTLAAVSLALLGFKSHVAVLYFLVTVAGATTIGSQILLYAYVAQFYPTAIRSTALGWSSGVGRIGAILGPVLGGALLAMQLSHQMNFLAFVVPGALAVIAIMLTAGRKEAV
ncbi:aromatic acid/H+ symport family MFS transporter [Uruburuella suis]|jgi:AAHS family benzoate transporter-like MFS transporter|uniref:AAHS family benzoate transporter-like MFS transporter n=1 Tax=Uruburuella suis TaxID=252130 RepID=A0AAE9KG57_9NEIS|nr:aromatic acid/H+ symport family MFS transporter [Uruburuella suis]MBP6393369.1 aromatic acid/H+ symport family MFS transporter [Neisseria sp.]MBP8069349.1 aromatic acid/H+ symport family MFS transporter [Neisseria sp.]MBP8875900.1 aromatic acid/H+ symport family MFS transporter [Neisseria sp.]TCP07895.1 AAHS family benzoate transporter-like MFS transporter [Uruburuella suis]UOO78525.1 aromatic acid/H+ symport family MFS transporter [Uruburuella suis]